MASGLVLVLVLAVILIATEILFSLFCWLAVPNQKIVLVLVVVLER
jgi:hypothetical protein